MPACSTPFCSTTSVSGTSVTGLDQESTMHLVRHQLKYAIWEDSQIIDKLYQSSDVDVDAIISNLPPQAHPYKGTPQWNNGTTYQTWNLREADRQSKYLPVAWFQNQVINAIDNSIGRHPDCIFGNFRFWAWNRPMKEGMMLGNTGNIKPGIVAHSKDPAGVLSWKDIEIVEEVNDRWPTLIGWLATYARCLFAANESWTCVPTIGYNHRLASFRLFFFTRAGITATPDMFLGNIQGFRAVIKSFILLSKWTPALAAVNQSHSQLQYRLEGIGNYHVIDTLCRRLTLTGTASRVYVLAPGSFFNKRSP